MSLHPHANYPVPDDTQRVAHAAFPHGNIYMQVADRAPGHMKVVLPQVPCGPAHMRLCWLSHSSRGQAPFGQGCGRQPGKVARFPFGFS